jgi:hypothetical protein
MSSREFKDETLVAYADGELDAKSAKQISEAIKNDEKLKQRVDSFRQTATLLKERLGVSNEVAPEHIKIRIQEIEKKILSNKININTQESNFLGRIFSSFIKAGKDFVSSHSIGGFAAGATFALMIAYIAPFNLMQTETGFSPEIDQQIIMRGDYEESNLLAYVEQNGQKINNEGTIKANIDFKVILMAPFDGDFRVFFVNESVVDELISGNVKKGELLNIPNLQAYDEKEIVLNIEIKNENSKFESTLKFIVNE